MEVSTIINILTCCKYILTVQTRINETDQCLHKSSVKSSIIKAEFSSNECSTYDASILNLINLVIDSDPVVATIVARCSIGYGSINYKAKITELQKKYYANYEILHQL